MIGIHVDYLATPGNEARLTAWQRGQVEQWQQSPGFLGCALTQALEEPRRFYALALWEPQADATLPAPPDALVESVDTARVEAIFDDVVKRRTDGMIGTHVLYRLKPEGVDQFIEWKQHEWEAQRRAPGFIKRSMVRSLERPTDFYYLTYWESTDAIDAFITTPEFLATKERTDVDAAFESLHPVRVSEVFEIIRQ